MAGGVARRTLPPPRLAVVATTDAAVAGQRRLPSRADYRLGTIYALTTAALLALQEPFSALAARSLTSVDFMGLTQGALLASIPLLISRAESRRDFAALLAEPRHWFRLAALFVVGFVGLLLYDVGLSSAHPIITAAVLNLSPFWAALVARLISRKSIPGSPLLFFGCFFIAFAGAMAIAWSQIDIRNGELMRQVFASAMRSKWIFALPMPIFFALSGTLVYVWFSGYDESAVIAANFLVSSAVLIPIAIALAQFGLHLHRTEPSMIAVLLLLMGTLAASAAGRVFYQAALTATHNDNGFVTMFFLAIPLLSVLVSWPLSHWIADVSFIFNPLFFAGMALVTGPLLVFSWASRNIE